jgi:hypothetical protein
MAGHAAGIGTTHAAHDHVEHIQELTGEVGTQLHIASHLMILVVKVAYDFLTVTCLTAGIIFLATGRTNQGAAWGGAGLFLALMWLSTKGVSRVLKKAFGVLAKEMSELTESTESHLESHKQKAGEDQPQDQPR